MGVEYSHTPKKKKKNHEISNKHPFSINKDKNTKSLFHNQGSQFCIGDHFNLTERMIYFSTNQGCQNQDPT